MLMKCTQEPKVGHREARDAIVIGFMGQAALSFIQFKIIYLQQHSCIKDCTQSGSERDGGASPTVAKEQVHSEILISMQAGQFQTVKEGESSSEQCEGNGTDTGTHTDAKNIGRDDCCYTADLS